MQQNLFHKFFLFIITINSFFVCNAQQVADDLADSSKPIIINDQKVISNEMIFTYIDNQTQKPLYFVNGEEVYTLAFYNPIEFKKITVLQSKEAYVRYHKKARNGVVIAELKNMNGPDIEVLSNKLYYKCNINGKLKDTTKEYYNNHLSSCNILDLRDTAAVKNLYFFADSTKAFDNVIRIKNLGDGLDRTSISGSGGMMFGTGFERIICAREEGIVKVHINRMLKNKSYQTEVLFKAIKLP